jgi:hypothetical protein
LANWLRYLEVSSDVEWIQFKVWTFILIFYSSFAIYLFYSSFAIYLFYSNYYSFINKMNDSDLEILDNIHQDWTNIHEDFS